MRVGYAVQCALFLRSTIVCVFLCVEFPWMMCEWVSLAGQGSSRWAAVHRKGHNGDQRNNKAFPCAVASGVEVNNYRILF